MEGINLGKPASSNPEVVWRTTQKKSAISCLEILTDDKTPIKISCVEVVWQGNPGKICNILPGKMSSGVILKTSQSLTWKLPGRVTQIKIAVTSFYLKI
jgi:hypothetical protein